MINYKYYVPQLSILLRFICIQIRLIKLTPSITFLMITTCLEKIPDIIDGTLSKDCQIIIFFDNSTLEYLLLPIHVTAYGCYS